MESEQNKLNTDYSAITEIKKNFKVQESQKPTAPVCYTLGVIKIKESVENSHGYSCFKEEPLYKTQNHTSLDHCMLQNQEEYKRSKYR